MASGSGMTRDPHKIVKLVCNEFRANLSAGLNAVAGMFRVGRMSGVSAKYGARSYLVRSEMPECHGCGGAGQVFHCSRWDNSNGHCCPAGTQQRGCPGQSAPCTVCRESREAGAGLALQADQTPS